MHSATKEAIYKQVPFRNILDFINEKVVEITVNFIKYFYNVV